ncbi:hypothetical protein PVK06_027495 [Gossypium arboreum]|uniref:Uncharacterized protein n=1 Tax=Gossypium arboreum TaxID=29729 RepID=A0ABR0P0F5_GOSAR|nr:hypothetical protein PVK06_027495 [Gossypium arboreum]
MTVVPTGSECVAFAPKFKRCRVSMVRDFLPSCGRVTVQNFGLSSDAREFLVLYVIRCVTVCLVLIIGSKAESVCVVYFAMTVDRQNAKKLEIWRMMPHERAITRVVNRAHGVWVYDEEGYHERIRGLRP